MVLAAIVARPLPAVQAPEATPADAAHNVTFNRLAEINVWSAVSGIIGYRGRMWFANSVKYVNHNSADLYSYDLVTGHTQFERHLMSQDAGDPAIAAGLLYWPFEDSRLSRGLAEFAVTDGRRWRWRDLGTAFNFHAHAMVSTADGLYAATSGWQGAIAHSNDGGRNWTFVYAHPTPQRQVSRFTSLAALANTAYAGLTSRQESGPKLFVLSEAGAEPVSGWPDGESTTLLTAFGSWLYAINYGAGRPTLWRTDGKRVQQIPVPGAGIQDMTATAAGLVAVSANGDRRAGGDVWRSRDGVNFEPWWQFDTGRPIDLAFYRCRIYVGLIGPRDAGQLWGSEPLSGCKPEAEPSPSDQSDTALEPDSPRPLDRPLRDLLQELDAILSSTTDLQQFRRFRRRLHELLAALSGARDRAASMAMSERLATVSNPQPLTAIGGNLHTTVARAARWYLLGAIARSGTSVTPTVLNPAWKVAPNPPEKYFEPLPAAAWAMVQANQDDWMSIDALVAQLDRRDLPRWAIGDIVGALGALTGQNFGYDISAWQGWWRASGIKVPLSARSIWRAGTLGDP